jgi:hypothetical protein
MTTPMDEKARKPKQNKQDTRRKSSITSPPRRKSSASSPVSKATQIPAIFSPIKLIVIDESSLQVPDLIGKIAEWVTMSLQKFESVQVMGVDPLIGHVVSICLVLESEDVCNYGNGV